MKALAFSIALLICSCAPSYSLYTEQFLSRERGQVDAYLSLKQSGQPFEPTFYLACDSAFGAAFQNARVSDTLTVKILALIEGDIFGMKPLDSLGLGSTKYYADKQSMLDAKFAAAIANERSKK